MGWEDRGSIGSRGRYFLLFRSVQDCADASYSMVSSNFSLEVKRSGLEADLSPRLVQNIDS